MTHQTPSYNFLHAAADAGVGALTSSTTPGEATGYPLDNLIDYRVSSLFRFGQNGWGSVKVDRGTQPMSEACDRIIIPAGHNLENATVCNVHSSVNDSDWTTRVANWDQSAESDPDGIISKDFSASTTDRYLRFRIQTVGYAWEFGQLFFTRKRTPTRGPDPDWIEQQVSNTVSVPFPARTASLSLAANRWRYQFKYNRLDGADLTLLDDLIEAVGIDLLPFYFDAPDDTSPTGPLLMKINGDSYSRKQARRAPAGPLGAAYDFEFAMLEEIG
jgi:hypothetical protein